MLIQWYRVGSGSLINNLVGTQTLTASGNTLSSSFCPSDYSTPPYSQNASPQNSPFTATALHQLGGYSQLYFSGTGSPIYLSQGTTSFWELLTQQLNGQNQDYHSLSNPMLDSGTPKPVVQHTLDNPADFSSDSPDQSQMLITGETLMLTGANPSPYPVCNIQQSTDQQSASVTCTRDSPGRRNYVQFTPMRGLFNAFHYGGIGFVNTDDGLYVFFAAFLRGGSFSCKPKDDHSDSRNKTDDDPNGSHGKKSLGRTLVPLVPIQSRSTY